MPPPRCPIDECKEIEDIKKELFSDPYGVKPRLIKEEETLRDMKDNIKEKRRVWPYYISSSVIVALAIAGSIFVMWANARDFPEVKKCVTSNTTGIQLVAKDVTKNSENLVEFKSEVRSEITELKRTQSAALENTVDIKKGLEDIKKALRKSQ